LGREGVEGTKASAHKLLSPEMGKGKRTNMLREKSAWARIKKTDTQGTIDITFF